MPHEPLNPELSAIEAALASLAPTAPRLNRDRVMYLAGQAAAVQAARRGVRAWLWPCATAAALVLSAILGLREFRAGGSGAEPVIAKAIARPEGIPGRPGPSEPTGPAEPNEYLRLRELVLRDGVEALPESTGVGAPSDQGAILRAFGPRAGRLPGDPSA
jgi:hypothetical protein